VKSINLVLLGQEEDYTTIIKEMGAKKGTTTDISIYDRKIDDVIYTYAIPITFPDKIQPLIQAINLGQYVILSVTKVDRFLGEQIIALDSLNFTDGFILHSYQVDEEKLRTLVRNTSVYVYKIQLL
jgi:selenocysteine-specific translation elongation factor